MQLVPKGGVSTPGTLRGTVGQEKLNPGKKVRIGVEETRHHAKVSLLAEQIQALAGGKMPRPLSLKRGQGGRKRGPGTSLYTLCNLDRTAFLGAHLLNRVARNKQTSPQHTLRGSTGVLLVPHHRPKALQTIDAGVPMGEVPGWGEDLM